MMSNHQDWPPENLDKIRGTGWKIMWFQTVVARREESTSTSSTISLRNPFSTSTTTDSTTTTPSDPDTSSTTTTTMTTTTTTTRHSSTRSTTPTSTPLSTTTTSTCSADIPDCIISSLLPSPHTSSHRPSSSSTPPSSSTSPLSSSSSSHSSSSHRSSSHTTSSSSPDSDPPRSKPLSTSPSSSRSTKPVVSSTSTRTGSSSRRISTSTPTSKSTFTSSSSPGHNPATSRKSSATTLFSSSVSHRRSSSSSPTSFRTSVKRFSSSSIHRSTSTTPTKTSPTASSHHPSPSSTPPPRSRTSQKPSHTSRTSSVSTSFSTPSPPTLLPHSSTRISTSHATFHSASSHSVPSSSHIPFSSRSLTSVKSSAAPVVTVTSTSEPAPTFTTTPNTTPPHVIATTYDISISHIDGVTTTTSGGMLRTNVPGDNNNSFAHNAGAIAGTTVGTLIALAFVGLWIFLTLRRRRKLLEQELNSSSEQVNISPHGGWRSPLADGDEDDHDPTRYATILAQLRAAGTLSGDGEGEGGDDGHDDGDGDGNEAFGGSDYGAGVGTASVYSALSAPSSDVHYPYMTGFGQAAETMRDENAAIVPAMTMVDGAPLGSHRRSLSGGLESPTWFVGQNMGYLDTNAKEGALPSVISSHEHLSASGRGAGGSVSKNASYEEDIFQPARSSSSQQLVASSSSDIDSSTGRRPSMDGKRQSSVGLTTPPTSFSFRKRAGSEHNSLKDIIGRLRGSRGSSPPGPTTPEDERQSPPPSASPTVIRFPESSYSLSTSQAHYAPVVSIRSPTPPSSLLRPQSPGTPNVLNQRPSMSAHSMGDRLWPRLTLPPVPSPAVSDDSHDIASEGLLDPRLPWRLGQTRADSTTSLRDHEDYSRPIGALFVHNGERSRTSVGTNNTLET